MAAAAAVVAVAAAAEVTRWSGAVKYVAGAGLFMIGMGAAGAVRREGMGGGDGKTTETRDAVVGEWVRGEEGMFRDAEANCNISSSSSGSNCWSILSVIEGDNGEVS